MKRLVNLVTLSFLALITLLIPVTLNASAPAQSSGRSVSTIVSPEAGGKLISPDGLVTITIPAGMFSEATVITYTETAITALPPALVSIGPSFALQAARLSDGQPITIFEIDSCPGVTGKPSNKSECGELPKGGIEISIRYSDVEVKQAGVAESGLTLGYFYSLDGKAGKWRPLTTVISKDQNIAAATTWYLARFALLSISHRPARGNVPLQVEVVVDDQGPGFARFQAGQCADPPDLCWWEYWSGSGAYNGHSYYTQNSNNYYGRENWGEWTPNIPQSGHYEIFAFIPWNYATTASAYYHIYRDGSEIGTVRINQNGTYADWVSLGDYDLPAGSRSKVYLDDLTDNQNYAAEYIGFDAVKFVCQDCGGPGPTDTPGPTVPPGPTRTPVPPTPTPTKPSPEIIGRADWNCPTKELEAPYTTPVPQTPIMVVVHHTTSRNDPTQKTTDSDDKYTWARWSDFWFGGIPQGTVAQYYDPIKDTWTGEVLMTWLVERYKNNYTDLPYHYLIAGDGGVYQGSHYGIFFEKGATLSNISQMIQVALLGCFEPGSCNREGGAATPSAASTDSLDTLIEWLGCSETQFLLPNGGTADNIKGHRDIDPGQTVCPGQNLYDLLPDVRQQASCGFSSMQKALAFRLPDTNFGIKHVQMLDYPVYYITLMGHEGITLYVTDPLGRHLGVDPISGEIINEIPGADFEDNPVWGNVAARGDPITETSKLVVAHIDYPSEGLYRVQAHGMLGPVGGGLSLGARHNGDLKALRMAGMEPPQELPVEYQFIYSLDNEELVTELFQDVTPPTTTHQFYGTEGNNGWFTTSVTVSLEAVDDLSGVDFTEYKVDDRGWVTYTEPFMVTEEGIHPLQYRSVDRVGNQEMAHSVWIKIDKTSPVVTITQPAAITYTICSTFSVVYEAYDAISGLEAVTVTLDGQVITSGQTFDALFLVPGPHEIVVTARDRAGWQTVQTRTVIVEATIEGLICAKHRLYDMGWIYGPGAQGIVNSLDAKLEAALGAQERGQLHTAANILNAFVHEVEAQTGKHITREAAAVLIRGAQYITNQLVQQIPVSPNFGGRLSSLNETVRIDFPAGAVTELAIASYQSVIKDSSLTAVRGTVGLPFDLSATWYNGGAAVTNFLRPVTITVYYSNYDLAGINESRLALHYWNGKWIEVPTEIMAAENRAITKVNHFSTYALLEIERKVYLPLVLKF